MTIAGRKAPLLVKGAGMREAKDRIITACDPLNADEMETALTNGETVWREGDDFPADEGQLSIVGDQLLLDGKPHPGVKSIVFVAADEADQD
jgi:hypothetical protein